MFKKSIIILIVACVFLVTVPTLAETPSKTTEDLTRVIEIRLADESINNALIWIEDEPTELHLEQMELITTFMKDNDSVAKFFSDEMRQAMSALLEQTTTQTTDIDQLIMSEFVSLGIGIYEEKYGDVTGLFQFPTEFEDTQTALAVVGYMDDEGTMVWQPLETEIVDGSLQIVFPMELMQVIGQSAVLAVLSK